jgi:hypothetical protein
MEKMAKDERWELKRDKQQAEAALAKISPEEPETDLPEDGADFRLQLSEMQYFSPG